MSKDSPKVFSGTVPPAVGPVTGRPKSGAEILLEGCGFQFGRLGWTSDQFPGVEISELEAWAMDSRALLARLWHDGIRRGRESLKAEIRLNINAMLGVNL